MKRIILLALLVSCGSSNESTVVDAFVGSNPNNAPVAYYEGECIVEPSCQPELINLEVRNVNGDNYIYHEGVIVKIESLDDAISIDKNGLTCNYLRRTR